MSDNQKQVTAWFALGVLVLAVLLCLSMWLSSGGRGYLDTSDPENVRLTAFWSTLIFFIKKGAVLKILFAAVLTVLSVGLTLLADIYTRKRDLAIIAVLCLLGIISAGVALAQTSGDQALEEFRLYGQFKGLTENQVAEKFDWFFGALIGWFGSFLAAALSISLVAKKGALKGQPSEGNNS